MATTMQNIFVRKPVHAVSADQYAEMRLRIIIGIDNIQSQLKQRTGNKKLIYQVQCVVSPFNAYSF